MTSRRAAGSQTVSLAASPGGHLAELRAVRGAFADRRRVWVTGASSQADALREGGEEVHLLPAWGRDPPGVRGFPANLRTALRMVRARPVRVVVTTGAGLVVPYILAARLAGSAIVFIESMARVEDASLTGRIVAPLARVVLVQWPETGQVYHRARVCRPALLEAGAADAAGPGSGTFVSVGTRPEPFDRLLAMADRAVAARILPRPVVAQSGASRYRPESYGTTAWMAPPDVERAIMDARYVVCHAGAGMVAAAIAAGHRPLVLPRAREAGEHRTEHQRQLVEKLASLGAVVALEDQIGDHERQLADAPAGAGGGAGTGSEPASDRLPSVEEVLRAELGAVFESPDRGRGRQSGD